MNVPSMVLFYDKCRLCLEKPGSGIIEEIGLAKSVFLCTGVTVTPSDNLPQKICTECQEIVEKAVNLRELAKKNDEVLKSIFSDDDNEMETTDDTNVVSNTQCKEVQSKTCSNNQSNVESGGKLTTNQNAMKSVEANEVQRIAVRKDLYTSGVVTTAPESKNKEKKTHQCEICEKHFNTWKKLYYHRRNHNKNKMCPLDGCEKKFASKHDLEKHLRTHTGVRPYVCDICDKTFTQMVTLRVHKETVHYIFVVK